MKLLFALLAISLLISPGLATSPTVPHANQPSIDWDIRYSPKLTEVTLFPRDQGKVAEELAKAGSDILLELAESSKEVKPDTIKVFTVLVQTLQSTVLPPATNIEVEFAQGRVDDAIKDTMKYFVERTLTGIILAGAPLTDGVDLLLLVEVHVLSNLLVDVAYDSLKKLRPQSSPSATAVPNLPDTPGCNKGNYSSSPIFGQSNPFGTDAWRNCKLCCATWAEDVYAGFGGSCSCCTLVSPPPQLYLALLGRSMGSFTRTRGC